MDGERKVNLSEGVPLNSSGGANIFLNAGKNNKLNDGTVIHLTTGDIQFLIIKKMINSYSINNLK